MRVLVCGSRYWDDVDSIAYLLRGIFEYTQDQREDLTVIEGAANGADSIAGQWVNQYNETATEWHADTIRLEEYPADWEKYGKAAGPIRNKQMLQEGKPDIVFAFTDDLEESKGTKNMVTLAKEAGVRTYVIGRA